MDAKAEIIEYIRTEMTAMNQVWTPGTDLNAKLGQERDALENKINAQRKILAKQLADVDAREAAALEGTTMSDRLNAAMDAAIKKLDATYSTEGVEQKKIEKYEKAKARYVEAIKAYEELEKKAEAMMGALQEKVSSRVKTMSQMPLFGAVTIGQFESWDEDDEKYQIALVVMWSPKMEKIVRAMIQGEQMAVPPGKMPVKDWVRSQDWSTSTGSRRFRDDKGDVHFIGIASAAAGKTTSDEKKARGLAKQFAKQEAVFAVFADVTSQKVAQRAMETRSGGMGKDSSVAAEDFAQYLQEEIKGRQISGTQPLLPPKRYKHPISQQDIYVAIYGISQASARAALWAEEEAYLTAMLDASAQQASAGRKAGLESAVQEARTDQRAYNESKAAAEQKVKQEAANERASEAAKPTSGQAQAEQAEGCPPGEDCAEAGGKARSGSFSGAGFGDDNDW